MEFNNNEEMLEELVTSKFEKELLEKRKIFFWGTVNDKTCKSITDKLLYLEAKDPGKEISLYINSPGGVVTSGMVVYDTMQMISSPVSTICMGMAASMGSILLSGGEKGKRYMFPNGRVMIHQPSMGGAYGQASDIEITAKEIIKTKKKLAEILSKNTGRSLDDLMTDFERDFWMDAKESIDYGIADKVLDKISLK